ncbi:DUF2383 domain-containing protein [Denitrobaculum tricleocarpae]|uniref:DUF2383 domain-containing protein n=1 Tax=Denitrobaculum tricleocarpae TaxID=2591009 RepID=UPI0015D3D41E|nr:DUF2383 domain-containing protein [Denitrobaculum tricleocarpae]
MNDLIAACREAAGTYRLAAEKLQGTSIGRDCQDHAARRDFSADKLTEFVIAQDDVPNSASGEKALVESAVITLKSAVGFDEAAVVLENCAAKEKQLDDTANVVLSVLAAPELRNVVLTLRTDVAKALESLEQAKPEA